MQNDSTPSGDADDPRGRLTPVYALIEEPRVVALILEHSRPVVLEAVQEALDWYRQNLGPGDATPSADEIVGRVESLVHLQEGERMRPVVNATGVILHTGMGRAVLPRRAAQALGQLDRCCNMQVDLQSGKRGKRSFSTEQLLVRLTGAEAAMVVNNNAAATLLILTALCKDREVIVSLGQLIEIGGSFRLPDCIRESGATIVQVGTTNRTHLYDYERALSENTGAILRANPSNYRVIGFSKEVAVAELVSLKQKQPVLVIDDIGCGALIDTEKLGLPKELTVQESLSAGADLVCFSGDKLIGGPQSGIIVGRADLIARIKKHPLTRMMRVCKLTDTALEQSLRVFLDPDTLFEENPTLRMLALPEEELEQRAAALMRRLEAEDLPLDVRIKEDVSATGGGSMPAVPLPTRVLALKSSALSVDRLNHLLRQNEPPIIARISEGEVVIDLRTLLEGEEEIVCRALRAIAERTGS